MTARTDHGPTCVACQDPAGLHARLSADRARLDTEAQRAAEHRNAGEAARQQSLTYLTAGDSNAYAVAQARTVQHLGAANAIMQGVLVERAHLDRVEAAHTGGRS